MYTTGEISKESTSAHSKKKGQIPEYLVRETIDGIPFYYNGFRSVMNKTKKLEDIMADSGLQAIIKKFLSRTLDLNLDESQYWVLLGEIGNHLDHRSNMGLDVTVYDTKVLTPEKITSKYIDVHPKIVIEVDVKVELEDRNANIFEEFVLRKVKKLFSFGTEKIIWIFTKSKTVIVARPNNTWDVLDWHTDIELMDGIVFNIAAYLKMKGINPDV